MTSVARPERSQATITPVALDAETRALMTIARDILAERSVVKYSQSDFIRLAVKTLAVGVIKTTGAANTEKSFECAEALSTLINAVEFESIEIRVAKDGGEAK